MMLSDEKIMANGVRVSTIEKVLASGRQEEGFLNTATLAILGTMFAFCTFGDGPTDTVMIVIMAAKAFHMDG